MPASRLEEQEIHQTTLSNGMAVLVESMPTFQSAAFSLLVPAGAAYDAAEKNGTAAILREFLFRGAGKRDNRELTTALDALGVQYSSTVGVSHLKLAGASLAENLPQALSLFADIVRRPHLPEQEFPFAHAYANQAVRSMEDDPSQRLFRELLRSCYNDPWGRPRYGTLEDFDKIAYEDVKSLYAECFRPNDTILAIAGNIDAQRILGLAEDFFGDWKMVTAPEIEEHPAGPSRIHLADDSEQTQIGVAWPSVSRRHPRYYEAWATTCVLGDGMSSRLFTEVRERGGMCYSVYATHHDLRDQARVICHASTVPEKAQQTLDVLLREATRLKDDLGEDELMRCKAKAKSALIMQQESILSRAGSLAGNWYALRRVVPLDEVAEKVDRLSVDQLRAFLHEFPPRDLVVATSGPQSLEVPDDD